MAGRIAGAVSGLRGDGRGWILLVLSVVQLFSFGSRLLLPALLPRIKAAFLLSNTVAGLLLSVLWLSFALAQLPGGMLADRFGERAAMTASIGLGTASLAVLAVSPALSVFAVALVGLGLGTGFFSTPVVTGLADVYPDRAATAVGLNQAAGNAGNAAVPVVAAALAGWFGWRIGLGFTLPAFAVLVVGLYRLLPARTGPGRERSRGRGVAESARRVLDASLTRPVLLSTAGMILVAFVWQGFTAFLPTYLVEVKGLTGSSAALALGAFFLGGTVLQPVVGVLADRYRDRLLLALSAGTAAVALATVPVAGSLPAFLVLALLASLQLGFWPVVFAYVPRALPDDVQGSAFGLVRTTFLLVGATGPAVTGALADAGLFDEAFVLFGALAALAATLAVALPELP